MRSHIDWLTFTMTPRYGTYDASNMTIGEDYATAIEQAWIATFDNETLAKAFGGAWEKQEKSRAPYTDAWTLQGAGVTLYAGISLSHVCVEISGSGCERLIQAGLLEKILGAVADRTTRIDIACDIETEIQPTIFVSETKHKRMRSSGYQKSASGETCYVGSKTSERYARVYRYAEPHPRAHLLRVEHVFHKAYAKRVAWQVLEGGIDAVANAAGEAFGWNHDIWRPLDNNVPDISIVNAERNAGKTVFWLVNSVSPAFKRLCETGVISDPQEFIKRYFLPD